MRNSQAMKKNGFTLMELVVIIGPLAVLFVLCLSGLIDTKGRRQRLNCVNNLKQVGLSFWTWAGDHEDKYPMSISGRLDHAKAETNDIQVFRYFQTLSNELTTPIFWFVQRMTGLRL